MNKRTMNGIAWTLFIFGSFLIVTGDLGLSPVTYRISEDYLLRFRFRSFGSGATTSTDADAYGLIALSN